MICISVSVSVSVMVVVCWARPGSAGPGGPGYKE